MLYHFEELKVTLVVVPKSRKKMILMSQIYLKFWFYETFLRKFETPSVKDKNYERAKTKQKKHILPSSSALCASIAPLTTSPMA